VTNVCVCACACCDLASCLVPRASCILHLALQDQQDGRRTFSTSQCQQIASAAQQVAEALWLRKKPQFEQLDPRDKRSSLHRRGLTAPLLGQEGAEAVRELLMAERGKVGKNWQGESFEREFSLCEH
jgi:hypothetical protein